MWGCDKGGCSLSSEREHPPLHPLRERDEGPCPLTPHIAGLQLEELRSLRNQVRCTWLRHESLLRVTTRNRALLPWGACDVSTAADCVRNSGIADARRIVGTGGRRKLGCTSTRWAERHPQGVCRIRKAAEPPTAAQQRIIEAEANRLAVLTRLCRAQALSFRRRKSHSSQRLPIKSLSLGVPKGIFSFAKENIPFVPAARRRHIPPRRAWKEVFAL